MKAAIIGGDKRMLYAAKAFLDNGAEVAIAGFDHLQSLCDIRTASIADAAEWADFSVLPIRPILDEKLNCPYAKTTITADDFASYIVNYFASLILNVAAYIVTLLIVWGLIRLVIGAAGIFSRLPIIRTANRALGLGAGILQGLLIVWMLMMVLSFFAATPAGQNLMAQVYDNPFLELLYNTNPLMKGASSALKGIM